MQSLPVIIVDKEKDLKKAIESIQQSTKIAIDTEFLRESTYWPILCLLQIRTHDSIFIIDVLSKDLALKKLFIALQNPQCLKILHASRQDLECLFHKSGMVIYPIFDTQLAANFLNFKFSIGYADLVYQLLNVKINKEHQNHNWEKRPLTKDQIDYAQNDVRYLFEVYEWLHKEASQRNLLTYIEQDNDALVDYFKISGNIEYSWKRIQFNPVDEYLKAKIDQLSMWREEQVQRINIPRLWFLSDEDIIQIANYGSIKTLREKLRINVPQHTIRIPGTIKALLLKDENPLIYKNILPKQKRYFNNSGVNLFLSYIEQVAEDKGLPAGLIGNKKDIEQLIEHNLGKLASDWRYELVGQTILAITRQEKAIIVNKESKIQIIDLPPTS